ncbi:bifunctional riboflavin kinase/FAD synthetase [Salipaludibacillus sp. LMS25]|uniref:bifunctional riboflavin kinase/FAD synthetase n=1 Tax=Salipaludibacillus sp. LMS25 TaxID=2924031 RepID=UPI0020D12D3A|nr:bifunctional riboflavin kinase/FAD synthetase [Salipaludibacillus sp. LMS25]UTR15054.1 bifunctional riboflavin kinase/FAD synthetase [Salipaludibacillus sp. LMS25]
MRVEYIKHPHPPMDLPPTVMALGFFDGVHRGHQQVINTAKQEAKTRQLQSAVMTFYPHPKEVLRKQKGNINYLSPIDEKIMLLEKTGIDILLVVSFDARFSELSPQQFVDTYLIDLNVKHVVAGFDYSYGRLGKGTMETFPFHARHLLSHTTVPKLSEDNEKISSTVIREALDTGNMSKVNDYLGRVYAVEGVVEHGEKRGREIGFPTANMNPDANKELPAIGVYIVTVIVDGTTFEGVCNIGFNPTFNNGKGKRTIEAHLFHFTKAIYGKKIKVAFLKRIRSEKAFNGVEELKERIQKDIDIARHYFST